MSVAYVMFAASGLCYLWCMFCVYFSVLCCAIGVVVGGCGLSVGALCLWVLHAFCLQCSVSCLWFSMLCVL